MDRVKLKWRDGEFFVTDLSPTLPVESGPFYLTISSTVLKVDIRNGHLIVRQSEDELAISANADNNNPLVSGVDESRSSHSNASSSLSVQNEDHGNEPRSYGIERNDQIMSNDEQTHGTFLELSENVDKVQPFQGSLDSSLSISGSSRTGTQSSVPGQSTHTVIQYQLVDPKLELPELESTEADPMDSTVCYEIAESVPSTYNSSISGQSRTKRKEPPASQSKSRRGRLYKKKKMDTNLDKIAQPSKFQSKPKKGRPSKKNKMDTNFDKIEKYLKEKKYHQTIQAAWKELWIITDEHQMNCLKFVNRFGLNLGQLCTSAYPGNFSMAGSISGVFYSVSEVASIRPKLMTSEFLLYCLHPFESLSRYEVRMDCYNFVGLFAQLLSDKPENWTVENPSRQRIQNVLRNKITTWGIHLPFEIKYKSLKPVFQLLQVDHTVECQLYAIWILAYLTHISPKKYVGMLVKNDISLEPLRSMEKCPDEDVRLLVKMSLKQIDLTHQ